MPLFAAFCCLGLGLYSGHVYSETKSQVVYLVTNLYLIGGLILAGMVRVRIKRKRK